MIKYFKNILGITEALEERKKTNHLLEKILSECKKNSDLSKAWNSAHHIK